MKDHEPKDGRGAHPSRLVAPVESFMSRFSELGHLAMTEAIMKNKLETGEFAIVQGSSLKRDLENLNINTDKNSIASTDVANFCPLVSHSIIEKDAWFSLKT